ncbi:hypothetical protein OBBRIDRAFT_790976 [Obba rivulosa]|uniref:Uncharacterized protein n=1 Tax=Obba rivulosa TaxID=1052685 RepID=A0A8E2AY32_9APHY|nr:hypothetical protein OBBRIDRAFT_790976 [Obba rivulosa]
MPSALSVGSALLLIACLLAPRAAAQCPASQSNHLCCESFNEFSDNAMVWEEVCGNPAPADPSVMVGANCEFVTGSECGPPIFDEFFDLCCVSLLPCPGNTDGAIGFNCSGHQVE